MCKGKRNHSTKGTNDDRNSNCQRHADAQNHHPRTVRANRHHPQEDSPLPLSSWFVAIWQIANCKNGVSSCELARALGVTQKTSWFMLHRIRLAMRTGTFRKAFDDLARALARVPKREVVAAERRYERKKLKKKKS